MLSCEMSIVLVEVGLLVNENGVESRKCEDLILIQSP